MVKQKSNNNKNKDAITDEFEFKGNVNFFDQFQGRYIE